MLSGIGVWSIFKSLASSISIDIFGFDLNDTNDFLRIPESSSLNGNIVLYFDSVGTAVLNSFEITKFFFNDHEIRRCKNYF